MKPLWTQAQAIELCRRIEELAPSFGGHVALTGGTLYKDGPRKDCDILIYRIRQVEAIDVYGLMAKLHEVLAVIPGKDYGWCFKAYYEGRKVDFFFPERDGLGADEAPEYSGQ